MADYSTANGAGGANDDEEDDYLTMTFDDTASRTAVQETSLQRRQRLRREGEQRGRIKSKAELAAEEEAQRERGLDTSLLSASRGQQPKGKGAAMMAKMGFVGGALGAKDNGDARTEPLRLSVKDGREGIGLESEKKRKAREAFEAEMGREKRVKAEEGEYRERVRREREVGRWERQLRAAQMVAEKMDEENDRDNDTKEADTVDKSGDISVSKSIRSVSSRPLKSINVLWRGLARAREEAERDRRMRYDLDQSLSRLPTYEDDDEDADDKFAIGRSKDNFNTADDLDEEDQELDEFNALGADERLEKVVLYLRHQYRYCFWCKATYPNDGMEGCPGVTEEDHD
jgi:hypothetical protein